MYWFAWDWGICIVPFVVLCDSLCCCRQEVCYILCLPVNCSLFCHHIVNFSAWHTPLSSIDWRALETAACALDYNTSRSALVPVNHKNTRIRRYSIPVGGGHFVTLSTHWLHSLSVLQGASRQLSDPAMMQSLLEKEGGWVQLLEVTSVVSDASILVVVCLQC